MYKLVQKKEENVIHSLDQLNCGIDEFIYIARKGNSLLHIKYFECSYYVGYLCSGDHNDYYDSYDNLEQAIDFVHDKGYEIHIFTHEEIKDKLFK